MKKNYIHIVIITLFLTPVSSLFCYTYISNIFGEAGDATGNFARPKGIATDILGNIYVVDALYNSIQIFNEEGELLSYFGSKGSENGELWLPR